MSQTLNQPLSQSMNQPESHPIGQPSHQLSPLPYGVVYSLVPPTDKLTRGPTDHPDKISVDRHPDPITRRLRVLVRRAPVERPN